MHFAGPIQRTRSSRDLLLAWTIRTIRARYQQSALGTSWAIAQPAAMVLVFSIIFTQFVPINTGGPSYVVFSFIAMIPWTFFSASLTDMVNSLVVNMNLVTKIYFPREILPISVMLSRLLDFAIASLMLVILLIYFGTPLFPAGVLFLPVILGVQFAVMLGLGLLGAALNVFYRDIRHLFELLVRLLLYGSPVIYPVTLVPENWRSIYFLNPMAGVITAYRDVLLYETLPGSYLLISSLVAIAVLVLGYWFFKLVEPHFADMV